MCALKGESASDGRQFRYSILGWDREEIEQRIKHQLALMFNCPSIYIIKSGAQSRSRNILAATVHDRDLRP